MRINGRTLRPATLAERRLLLGLGVSYLRVPRSCNPYVVARRLRRAARGQSDDMLAVRELVLQHRKAFGPAPITDTPEPLPEAPVDGAPTP